MKLGIQPLLPTGNFLNKRYSIEMDFPDESNIPDNYKFLNEAVIATHMAEYPFFYKDGKPTYLPKTSTYHGEEPIITKEKPAAFTQAELLKQQMSTCTELKVLETYKFLVKNNQELQDFYNHQQKIIENGL
jgi:hypothetical protein